MDWRYGAEYDYWKYGWGLIFSCLYLAGIVAFVRHAWRARSEDVVYNWFSVATCFLAMGLVIYLIFIVQV